jgi:hypothetical protein
VEPTSGGTWQVALPDPASQLCFASLEDAKRAAYTRAAELRPCELVLYDAYHRVARRQLIPAA